ncbi:MAG: hypothetical protein MUF84_20770 [Anaerolineae bacterium]|jgi:hypothetical protein|nr:hypothetical protein [Anaerolineae bacterium]
MSEWIEQARVAMELCEHKLSRRREPIVLDRPLSAVVRSFLMRLDRVGARRQSVAHRELRRSEGTIG